MNSAGSSRTQVKRLVADDEWQPVAAQAGAVVLPPVVVQLPLSGLTGTQSGQKSALHLLTFIHLANIREVTPNIFVALLNQLKKGRMLNFTL